MHAVAKVSAVIQVARPGHDDSIRIFERQRPEQERIDDTKDGAVGADAERKSKDGDDREGRSFDQHSERVFQVGYHRDFVGHCSGEVAMRRQRGAAPARSVVIGLKQQIHRGAE